MQRAENIERRVREARKELYGNMARSNHVIRHQMDLARNAGLSESEMLVMLCVNLVGMQEKQHEAYLDLINQVPVPPFVIPKEGGGEEKT